jgi:hypothetical protein
VGACERRVAGDACNWPTPSVHHDPETLARDPIVKRVEGFIAAVEREL